MSEQLLQGIVRILDGNGDIAGTGFVLSESGLIATCSHVIQHEASQTRGIPRPEKVTIVFQVTGDEQDARVEPDWWLPWDAGDLAIIRAEGILPQGVQPLPLGTAEGTSGHEVSTFGFPDVGDIEGLGGDGRVVRVLLKAGRSILQLRSSEITVGFSGAPIWDKLRRRVTGMVSAITEPDRHHRLVETAFAISAETLRSVCPVLHLSEVCPYRGLAAFTEADSEFFCGRQQIVDGLLNRLRRDPRFLTILGPSGSGKSSVVQAGLIPQLRSGKLPGSDRWGFMVTRPATHPLDELTKQGLVDVAHDLAENVRVWLSQHTEQGKLVLVIDQFEELLSICPEAIRQDFLTQFVKLLHSPFPITVVLVMRDDFYSRLSQQEALVEWLERNRGPVHVPKLLKQDELITIVQKPAEAVGLRYEEGLVELIVKDTMETSVVSENSGQAGRSAVLPLLEFALTELWKRRQEGMLTHEAYHSLEGVAGALTQWADRAFYALEQGERRLAQRILTDLVYIGDESQGVLDSRRRRTLISLCRNESEQESVEHVVQHLVENRLLATDRDLQSNKETAEIIHDILLRGWGQLTEWIEEDRRFLTWHQELERLVNGWTIKHGNTKLLRGRDLTEAKGWLKERGTDLSQNEVAFLKASAAYRVRSLVSLIILFLLVISSTGIAGWYSLHQPPNPTHVSNLQDDGEGSLRWTMNNAPSGSTIIFDPGLRGTIVLTTDLLISKKNLSIRGPGARLLTISSAHQIDVRSGVSLRFFDLTFTGSSFNSNALLLNDGTLTLNNSIVSGNTAYSGGGTYNSGGGIYNNGTLTLTNSTVSGNTSALSGGGIYNDGTLTLTNSTISGNTAIYGGGILNSRGTVTLTNSTVTGNTSLRATGRGGGIYNDGTLTLTNSTVADNTASSNTAGGFYNNGTLTLINSTVSDNTATYGGGIYNSNMLTLTNSIVGGNTVAVDGGGIFNAGRLTLTSSTVSGNTASSGGGIFNYRASTLTCINSTISSNSASGPNSSGGGIAILGSQATITFCTIYGNKTTSKGGGISIEDSRDVHGNNPSQVSIRNSIIAGDHAGTDPDIFGKLTSLGYNLIQNTFGATFTPNEQHLTDISGRTFTDLKIDPVLRDNGGLAIPHTFTHALLPGSPALDRIPPDACYVNINGTVISTDQRGVGRPQGAGCDIGAYEYVPPQ